MSLYDRPAGECIEWPRARTADGYGSFSMRGRTHSAHRAVWEEVNGPIPPGHVVRHRCDNPPCINIDHLDVGTRTDNEGDKVRRGRHHNQKRTHCPKGHPLDGENLVPAIMAKGVRQCLTCRRESGRASQRRYRARKG